MTEKGEDQGKDVIDSKGKKIKMKIWFDGRWEYLSFQCDGYQSDKDGYCTCNICQEQKEIEQIKEEALPDDLFCID